ncbi:hypothetical protein [Pseudomonas ficuserectae]|uniref:hypothetical protein n=1 Tax=Pseudomonas ficuserectae TaxID=53410 RepID=UPI000AF5A480|nr:hypothetical protein [Pseudomonas ficuserectae]
MEKTKEQLREEQIQEALFFMQLYEEDGIINDWQVPPEQPDNPGYPEDLKIY